MEERLRSRASVEKEQKKQFSEVSRLTAQVSWGGIEVEREDKM